MYYVFDKVKDNLETIEFNLTQRCNFACTYCFVKQDSTMDMDYPMIQELMDLYTTPNKKYGLMLFGGEPLLHTDVICKILNEYTDRIKDGIIITNGSLLTEDFITELKPFENKVSIQISIDGPKEVHDKYRIDHNGNGTFDRVMLGTELLQKMHYKNWSFHATCSAYHMQHIYDIFTIMYKCASKKRKNIFGNIQIIHDCLDYNKETVDMYKQEVKKILEEYPEVKENIMQNFQYFNKEITHQYCSAGRNYFSFFGDGSIAPCHRVYTDLHSNQKTIVGNFITGLWNENIYRIFHDKNTNKFFGMEKCNLCSSKLCYPCYLSNYNNTKDFFKTPLPYCWFKKETDKIMRELLGLEGS